MKTLLLTLLALATVVALPGDASAQASGTTPQASTLRANGRGTTHFQGRGHFELRLKGNGVLVLEDAASHTIQLLGTGSTVVNAAGEMIITNFTGTVDVVGNGVKGTFLKGRLRMKARGRGRAVFIGNGRITVDGAPAGSWSAAPGTPVAW